MSYCKECANARSKGYHNANPESVKARWDRYRAADPERVRVQARRSNIKRYYHFTEAEYDALLEAQGGVCAICESSDPKGRGRYFHIDHDHLHCPEGARSCGKCIRGLLCHLCNIGSIEDPNLLRKKADYIEKFRINNPDLFREAV